MENIFKNNLRALRKKLKLTQVEFAKPLGIKGSFISSMELGSSNPSDSVLQLIEIKYRANKDWLLKDEGEMFLPDSDDTYIYKEGDAPELVGLLKMTRAVLKSDTDYSFSLAANIRSFHKSVQMERRLHDHEERIRRIETDKQADEEAIRKDDPFESKEKIIKHRRKRSGSQGA